MFMDTDMKIVIKDITESTIIDSIQRDGILRVFLTDTRIRFYFTIIRVMRKIILFFIVILDILTKYWVNIANPDFSVI